MDYRKTQQLILILIIVSIKLKFIITCDDSTDILTTQSQCDLRRGNCTIGFSSDQFISKTPFKWCINIESPYLKNPIKLEVIFTGMKCTWQTKYEYMSSEINVEFSSQLDCGHNCTFEEKCLNNSQILFPNIKTKGKYQFKRCETLKTPIYKSEKTVCKSTQVGCLNYNVSVLPNTNDMYKVFRIQGSRCKPEYSLNFNSTELKILNLEHIRFTEIYAYPFYNEIIPTHIIVSQNKTNQNYLTYACEPKFPLRSCFGYFQFDEKSQNYYLAEDLFQLIQS
jgi:hypothetical protein